MGCDIHMYREARVDGAWRSLDKWTKPSWAESDDERHVEYDDQAFTGRNYNLFGTLARGVRTEPEIAFNPRGLPVEMSPEVTKAAEDYACDAHNHSFLYLHELMDLRETLSNRTTRISGMKDAEQLQALRASIASGSPNWDLLYPYCQGTNDPRQIEFSIEVPADFIVGSALDEIIGSLSGAPHTLPRIVFWFDN